MQILKLKHKKSVLFFNPDYHCSFFLRDEMRKRGWRAEIFVTSIYPRRFLFNDQDVILENISYGLTKSPKNLLLMAIALIRRLVLLQRYEFVIHYGSLNFGVDGDSFGNRLYLQILSFFYKSLTKSGTKIVYLPSGCKDHKLKADWAVIDSGRVCGSCGYEPLCNDSINSTNFSFVRRYASIGLSGDAHRTNEYEETFIRYKSLDLDVFNPNMAVPEMFRWPNSDKVRILHSHSLENRNLNDKNIKGTPFIIKSVENLKAQGYEVELVNISGVESKLMRFHQVQADIVVDQLIYGGYGSTAVECLALGKPVVCYVRDSWKDFLIRQFPEWKDCPIVSAPPESIEMELKKLVENQLLREHIGRESRRFAEGFLDARKNVIEFEQVLISLSIEKTH